MRRSSRGWTGTESVTSVCTYGAVVVESVTSVWWWGGAQVKSRLDRLYDHLEDWRAAALDAEPPPPSAAPAAAAAADALRLTPEAPPSPSPRRNKRGRAPAKRGTKG